MKKIYLLLVAGIFTISVTAQTTKTKATTKAKTTSTKNAAQKSETLVADKVKAAQPKLTPTPVPAVDEHAGHNHAAGAHNDVVKPTVTGEDNLSFKELTYDFGKIPQGKPVTHDFVFTNSGKTELKIENVQASCGCTTPEWKPGPYKPGESSKINVGFNAATVGASSKTVTITYNGGLTKVISFTFDVLAAPPTPAPENKGVGMLKGN